MRFESFAICGALLFLASCGPTTGSGNFVTLPEAVVAMAAPDQDLNTVSLREDGCYWYQYRGPVETTELPLRSREGRPICTRAQVQ